MPNITSNFSSFHLQPWPRVLEAWGDLVTAEEELRRLGPLSVERLYIYIHGIDAALKDATIPEPLAGINRELIRFFDCGTVWEFIGNPVDKLANASLTIAVLLVAAAVAKLPGPAPYTDEELTAVLQGDREWYTDEVFVRTLKYVRQGEVASTKPLADLLVKTLPRLKEDDPVRFFWWDDAFIQAALLQALWRHFAVFGSDQQSFLLQNYYYQSLVAGVPVRYWLGEALGSAPTRDAYTKLVNLIERQLEANHELVPLSTISPEGKLFPEILKEYVGKVYSEKIGMLAQEQFLGSFYRQQPGGEQFRLWLREALNIVLHLKKGTLIVS